MDYLYIVTLVALILGVKECQSQHAVVTPFKNQGGMVGHSVTLSTVLKKQSLDDWIAISYDPPKSDEQIVIWQEDHTVEGAPSEIVVTHSVNTDTMLAVYNVTISLPDVEATLLRLAVYYKAYFLSDLSTYTRAKVHVVAPISCHVTGDIFKQVDEQANLTCETRFYGGSFSSVRWYASWFHISHHYDYVELDLNRVGHGKTVIHRRVSEVDDGQVYTCNLRNFFGVSDSCSLSYTVKSCNNYARCVVNPLRNAAGKPGDLITLTTTFRKQAVNDWVAVAFINNNEEETVIWQENDTRVIPPKDLSVTTFMDKSTLYSTYNITIQLPEKTSRFLPDNAIMNVTGTYKAYMISYLGAKSSAKVAVIDDVSCHLRNGPEIIAGQQARISCISEYMGYTKPVLSWHNESGQSVSQSSSYHQVGSGPFGADISPRASGRNDGTMYQCRMFYNLTEFDYFPPAYQDTCNASFTVLYGTKCSMDGGLIKQPGDSIQFTCWTKYDGVNIPDLDWYEYSNWRSQKLTSRVEINNVTREYKVYMTRKAGTSDESFQCRLKYNYVDNRTQWEERVRDNCIVSYKSSVTSEGAIFSMTRNVLCLVLILQSFMALCRKW